jgi:hypothetical protein
LPVAQANLEITVTPFPWTRIEEEACSGYKIAKHVPDRFTAMSTNLRTTPMERDAQPVISRHWFSTSSKSSKVYTLIKFAGDRHGLSRS